MRTQIKEMSDHQITLDPTGHKKASQEKKIDPQKFNFDEEDCIQQEKIDKNLYLGSLF